MVDFKATFAFLHYDSIDKKSEWLGNCDSGSLDNLNVVTKCEKFISKNKHKRAKKGIVASIPTTSSLK